MKRFCSLLISLLTIFGATAQDITTLFVDMPLDYYAIISKDDRTTLMREALAGSTDSIRNMIGGFSRVLKLDTAQHFLHLQATSSTDFQLMHIPSTVDYLLAIKTACAPMCTSVIDLYICPDKHVASFLPTSLHTADFVDLDALPDDDALRQAIRTLPTAFVKAVLDPVQRTVTFHFDGFDYTDVTLRNKIEPLLHPCTKSLAELFDCLSSER